MKISKRLILILVLAIIMCLLIPLTAFADDIFSTTGNVSPEKDIYYVGDTVDISDYYRNKSAGNANNVTVEYYYRLNGANSVYNGSPINFGTIASGTSKSHSFQYTFKEADIGEYRIGSKITYSTSGGGPFNEYSSGHNFVVELAPTPTQTPSETPTAPPTETPTETPAPTETPTATPAAETPVPIETLAPIPTAIAEVSSSASSDANSSAGIFDNILGDSTVTIVIIIILAVVAILIIVIIILLISKRNK